MLGESQHGTKGRMNIFQLTVRPTTSPAPESTKGNNQKVAGFKILLPLFKIMRFLREYVGHGI